MKTPKATIETSRLGCYSRWGKMKTPQQRAQIRFSIILRRRRPSSRQIVLWTACRLPTICCLVTIYQLAFSISTSFALSSLLLTFRTWLWSIMNILASTCIPDFWILREVCFKILLFFVLLLHTLLILKLRTPRLHSISRGHQRFCY